MKIITDSTCDMSLRETDSLDVEMLSLKVNFGEDEYIDKKTITNEEFYKKLRNCQELPTTSLISVGDFATAFERHNNEEILVLTLSSKFSGTYQSAVIAKEALGRSDIHIVDTETVSIGLGLLVKLAAEKRNNGETAKQIAKDITKLSKKLKVFAILDSLKYLVKGGRLSNAQGAIGSMLAFKPIIAIQNGEVFNISKKCGLKGAVTELAKIITEQGGINFEMPISFTHSGNLPLLRMIYDKLGYSPQEVPYYIGSIVGVHTGPGAAGLAYFDK